ncbi:MAG: hypothetical protein ACLP9L_34720 [Thermoguttaceae bacterium]
MANELETAYIQIDTIGVQAAQDTLSALMNGLGDLSPKSAEVPNEPQACRPNRDTAPPPEWPDMANAPNANTTVEARHSAAAEPTHTQPAHETQIDTIGVQAAQEALSALTRGLSDLTPRSANVPAKPTAHQRYQHAPRTPDQSDTREANHPQKTIEPRHEPTTRPTRTERPYDTQITGNEPEQTPAASPIARKDDNERPPTTERRPMPLRHAPGAETEPRAASTTAPNTPSPVPIADAPLTELLAAQSETNTLLERIAAAIERQQPQHQPTY